MSDATCKTCPYFIDSGECGDGRCVLRPPADSDLCSFARTHESYWCGEHPLRQRDRLAAMAMQGLCADALPADAPGADAIALRAYFIADAMLAVRGEKP